MAQDDHPERETVNSKQETEEQAAEERPDFEVKEEIKESREQEAVKPEIPETTKPEMPKEENISTGGPGTQGQPTQTTPPPQTQEEKTEKIKEGLKKPIHTGTPRERVESSEIEGKHNEDVLSQP